jgi:hypothetical protein
MLGWADGDDLVSVDPGSLEELLEELAARFGVGLVFPEAAEVFEYGACAVEVRGRAGGEGVQFGVEGLALCDVVGAFEVAEFVPLLIRPALSRTAESGYRCAS